MILDKLSNSNLYTPIHKDFEKVFDFIKNTDLEKIDLGKHEIDGDTVFVVVMEYTTQDVSECKSETHKKYIDIQYMIEGAEHVGVTTLHNEEPTTPYNEEGDFMFYTLGNLPTIQLKKEHFAIFFPDDIHQTMMQIDSPKTLRKAVFKILK
ncbi:YhcH/YjgK/YiaL family protein [Flavicella sp.]|uniref:YhcH/YjgK/YiaL family protein n=1 Tax=Flavicella sp. TaxID=2957742 RepID=UPI00260B19DD|nr:YhcH/YjgK/YiaL family protein [Flavicella sp.]MDG1803789.1 YhcH/YjgK/YiaL family protein [Flavicella sp.]